MRNYLALLISLVFLTACGGGAGGGSGSTSPTGSTIPVGIVSGTSFDGLIINGTVSVYDFTTGAKGALLGQTTSDGTGLYSLSLQVESRPVLLEIIGGYYVEEAGPGSTQVALSSNQKLTALANYTTGSSLKVAVTTYTHLAAGLAAFEISKGTAVSTAINNSNTRASSLAGVNILITTPKEITDVSNASATLTPELKYGFLAGAISMWTFNNTPAAAVAHLPPYTSIDFAQLLYQDISADGLLDGIGIDSTGATAPLSFGTTPLGVDVYRKGLGVSLVQMAVHPNNKTALGASQVLAFAQNYAANTDAMFNNIAPIPIAAPVVTITSHASNAWVSRTANVAATIQDLIGIASTELIVDNASVATSTSNNATQSFQLDTTKYSDGAHSIGVRTIDLAGQTTTTTIPIGVDNVAPTSTGVLPTMQWPFVPRTYTVQGCASGGGSGILSITFLSEGIVVTPDPQTGCWNMPNVIFPAANGIYQFIIKNRANSCSVYNGYPGAANMSVPWYTAPVWGLLSSGPCQ